MKSARALGQRASCPLVKMVIMALAVATSAILPLCAGTAGVEGLARRVVGDKAECFAFVLDANRGSEKEYFTLSSREDGKIVVKANSLSAQCAGLGWYLRHIAKVQVFWEGVSRIPETLPPVAQEIRKETPYRYRVAFNYCAHSYSLAFADKARWEREIDILALHGVNLPLAITGRCSPNKERRLERRLRPIPLRGCAIVWSHWKRLTAPTSIRRTVRSLAHGKE